MQDRLLSLRYLHATNTATRATIRVTFIERRRLRPYMPILLATITATRATSRGTHFERHFSLIHSFRRQRRPLLEPKPGGCRANRRWKNRLVRTQHRESTSPIAHAGRQTGVSLIQLLSFLQARIEACNGHPTATLFSGMCQQPTWRIGGCHEEETGACTLAHP